MPDLPSLVQQLRDQGYSDDYIKQYLQDYGYTEQEIQPYLRNTVRHEHHVTPSTIIMLVLVLAGVGTGIYFFLFNAADQALLDVTTQPRYTQLQPGQQLNFKVKLTNMGDENTFDVHLTYQLLHENTVQRTTKETVAVSTTTTKIKQMPLPPPGKYTLRTVATYNDKQANASFTFTVTSTNKTTKSNKAKTEQNNTKTSKNVDAIFERVRDLAATRPSTAEQECLKLTGTKRDDCLTLIVRKSQRPQFCNKIISNQTRDNCYMNFIVEGQAQLCNKVVLNSSKQYCDRLEDVQLMAQYQ